VTLSKISARRELLDLSDFKSTIPSRTQLRRKSAAPATPSGTAEATMNLPKKTKPSPGREPRKHTSATPRPATRSGRRRTTPRPPAARFWGWKIAKPTRSVSSPTRQPFAVDMREDRHDISAERGGDCCWLFGGRTIAVEGV